MSDVGERSELLASALDARRDELGLTWDRVLDLTGLSDQGLMNVRKGLRRKYQARTTGPICAVMRWRYDSIDRLLRGEPAVPLDASIQRDDGPTGALRERVEVLAAQVGELLRVVHGLGADVEQLKRGGGQAGVD
jgi:hypothetical protein